jgi:hypothetical protein
MCNDAFLNGYAITLQQLFTLVFVDIHAVFELSWSKIGLKAVKDKFLLQLKISYK